MYFLVIFLLFVCNVCFGDVFVIYESTSKEVYSVSEKDDTVLPDGHDKKMLLGTIEQLGLEENPTNYTYKSNKFILNSKKINEQEKKMSDESAKKSELELIEKKQRKAAFEQLKAEGVVFEHVTDADFE